MRTRKSPKITGAVSTSRLGLRVGVCLLLGAVAGAHIHTRIEATRAGYALSRAHAEREELRRERRTLELEISTRRAAARIEGDARERLGLVTPDPEQIIEVPGVQEAPTTAVAQAEQR